MLGRKESSDLRWQFVNSRNKNTVQVEKINPNKAQSNQASDPGACQAAGDTMVGLSWSIFPSLRLFVKWRRQNNGVDKSMGQRRTSLTSAMVPGIQIQGPSRLPGTQWLAYHGQSFVVSINLWLF